MELKTSNTEERIKIDEEIYLAENRFDEPKEIFKTVSSIIEKQNFSGDIKVCDVGCSTGEFLYYLKKTLPQCSVTGVDVSNLMLQQARKMIPTGNFFNGDINSSHILKENSFDVITMIGVLSIFDEPRSSIKNCVSALKKNGSVIIAGLFNTEPIDVIVRYRKSDSFISDMLSGWNVHSCKTIERILNDISSSLKFCWYDFKMPFEIKKTSDSMRTWTIKINGETAIVNGASQIVDMKILEIRK